MYDFDSGWQHCKLIPILTKNYDTSKQYYYRKLTSITLFQTLYLTCFFKTRSLIWLKRSHAAKWNTSFEWTTDRVTKLQLLVRGVCADVRTRNMRLIIAIFVRDLGSNTCELSWLLQLVISPNGSLRNNYSFLVFYCVKKENSIKRKWCKLVFLFF